MGIFRVHPVFNSNFFQSPRASEVLKNISIDDYNSIIKMTVTTVWLTVFYFKLQY